MLRWVIWHNFGVFPAFPGSLPQVGSVPITDFRSSHALLAVSLLEGQVEPGLKSPHGKEEVVGGRG